VSTFFFSHYFRWHLHCASELKFTCTV
jgi:hypothetical protein